MRWTAILGLTVLAATALGQQNPIPPGLCFDLGPSFNTIGAANVGQHVEWARPLPAGPIKALFLAPRSGGRDLLELIARVDIRPTTVLTWRSSVFGHNTDYFVVKGASEAELSQRLGDALAGEVDAIVIGNVQWKAIPPQFREAILGKVRAGAGLLCAFADADFTEALAAAGAKPAPGPAAHVTAHALGSGRVVLIDYGTAKPSPCSSLTLDRPGAEYENEMFRLAAALLYAAGREQPIRTISLKSTSPRSLTLSAAIPRQSPAAQLSIWFGGLDVEGRRVFEKTIEAAGPQQEWTIDLPALPGGTYRTCALIRAGGRVIGAATAELPIPSPAPIDHVQFDRESYRAGQPIRAQFRLKQPLPEGLELAAAVRDNFGRIVSRSPVVLEPDRVQARVEMPLPPPLTCLHYLRIETHRDGDVLGRQEFELPMAISGKLDDFSFVGWGGPDDQTFSSRAAAEVYRQAGIDTYSGGFDGRSVRSAWTVNMRNIPYAWRIGAHYDKAHPGVTDPCVTDPVYLEQARKRFIEKAAECARYGVPGYHLGDESYYILFDPWHGDGVCYTPTCQAAFRSFLQARYGTIEALNRAWRTSFGSWDRFNITGPEELRRGGAAAREDHYCFLADQFTQAHRFAIDAIHESDPGALIGLEGTEALDAASGIDWFALMNQFGLQNVYPYIDWSTKAYNRHCVRSFSRPEMILGMWYGGYPQEQTETVERFYPWYSLMLGFNSIWWFELGLTGGGYVALGPDLAPLDAFRQTSDEVRQIKSGIGKLVMSARRDNDPIAILYSQRSFDVDTLELPDAYERRSLDFTQSISNFLQCVLDLGFQFEMVASEQLESGILQGGRYKVLILPMSRSLSDREAEAIRGFVEAGGVVIADVLTGVRDEHLLLRDRPLLDEVFGIRREGGPQSLFRADVHLQGSQDGLALNLDLPDRDSNNLTPTTGQPLGDNGRTFSTLIVNRLGKGKAVYFNFPFDGYMRQRFDGRGGAMGELMNAVLRWAGLEPRIRVTGDDGAPLRMVEIAQFARPGLNLTMLYRDHRLSDRSSRAATITWPKTGHIYDVRAGKYLGRTDHIQRQLVPGRVEIFACLPQQVGTVRVAAPASARAGSELKLELGIDAPEPQALSSVLHLEFRDPLGAVRDCYTKNILLENGRAEHVWRTAMNDALGKWTISARDVISGQTAQALVEVEPEQ